MPHDYSATSSERTSRSAAHNNTSVISRPAVPVLPGIVQRYTKQEALAESHADTETIDAKQHEPVQFFSKGTYHIDGKNVKGFMSENGNYFVVAGESYIYATSAPKSCVEAGPKVYNFNAKNYKLYVPDKKFLDDCLHTAEEIINGKKLKFGQGTYSKERQTGLVFGQSDTRNIEIAEKVESTYTAVNESANPGVGQAYVIVDTEFETSPSKRSPYHAAGVIAVDGNDRITMEVFAGGGSVTNRNTDSIFDIYEVSGGDSFHSYWIGKYFKTYKAITIVIKPK